MFFLNLLVTRALNLKFLFNKTLLFTAKVWCRQAGYRRLNMVEAVFYTGSRNPGRGDRVEQKPKKKKRGLVRSLTLRLPVSSTAGPIAPRLPISPWLYIPQLGEEGIQREKGKVVCGRSRSGRRIYLYRRPCQ